MKTIIEKTRIVKQQPLKVRAWLSNGTQQEIYLYGSVLNGCKAKYFIRNRESDKVTVIRGKAWQNGETGVYFLSDKG